MWNWRRDRQPCSGHWPGDSNWRCYRRLNVEVPALNFLHLTVETTLLFSSDLTGRFEATTACRGGRDIFAPATCHAGPTGRERPKAVPHKIAKYLLSNTHTNKPCFGPRPKPGRSGPSRPEKCREQGAATKTVRMVGEEPQRSHRHLSGPRLRPALFKFQALFGSRGNRIL